MVYYESTNNNRSYTMSKSQKRKLIVLAVTLLVILILVYLAVFLSTGLPYVNDTLAPRLTEIASTPGG